MILIPRYEFRITPSGAGGRGARIAVRTSVVKVPPYLAFPAMVANLIALAPALALQAMAPANEQPGGRFVASDDRQPAPGKAAPPPSVPQPRPSKVATAGGNVIAFPGAALRREDVDPDSAPPELNATT